MKTLDDVKLSDNERASIIKAARVLKAGLPVSRVILFGSKARGDAEPDSDIDLLVLTSCPVTTELRYEITQSFFDISLERDVSLSRIVVSEDDWLNGLIRYMPIHDNIEKEGCAI
ncbi:MAG: nucleotidyltransferase domain-containing protein [Planctomycetota bacterium]